MLKHLALVCTLVGIYTNTKLECQERPIASPCVETNLSSCFSTTSGGAPSGCSSSKVKTSGTCTEYYACEDFPDFEDGSDNDLLDEVLFQS